MSQSTFEFFDSTMSMFYFKITPVDFSLCVKSKSCGIVCKFEPNVELKDF